MKYILPIFLGIIIVFTMFGTLTNNNAKTNSDYLRIHIRANSNSEVDQNLKYEIKDEMVEYLTPLLSECDTKEKVFNLILSKKKELENLANMVLKQNNMYYESNIKICEEMFPTRSYEDFVLEAGVYDAVIVELGEAKGNNWWCVIYPPLCFTNFSQNSFANVVYKSKILEIIRLFFN